MNQSHLFNPNGDECGAALLLSIRPQHAARIFDGQKKFELRKALPKKRFARVYLYESGGRGIVGCFDAGRVIHRPLDDLWESVGEHATTRERFDAYFGSWQKGYAIEVLAPLKFSRPLRPPELKDAIPTFTAPQSFLLLQPGEGLFNVLEEKRNEHLGNRSIRLERIRPENRDCFIEIVTEEISRNYDEITQGFAESLIKLDALGEDPNGIFTISKEVYSAYDAQHGLIGFTTLTFKLGGAAKTGPTILFPDYRGKGYGTSLRSKVVELAKQRGLRKLYCTCPDTELPVIRHLLGNGYRVEAHLTAHYRPRHGELVFGMRLDTKDNDYPAAPKRRSLKAVITPPTSFPDGILTSAAQQLLSEAGYPVDGNKAAMLVRRAKDEQSKPYESKPISMICMARDSQCVGLMILIPKRGGATKGILAASTSNRDSIAQLLSAGEKGQRDRGRRKLYFAQPLNDQYLIDIMIRSGYQAEGLLKQPYKPGLDALVMSKHI
ncbi:GNAT family N-acetyltransferase [Tautonia plasticadhaerens]|uniref:Acetyltransferase (GNAT) family protein n=1 Tax=Tautonia plasticadhaerens TaxID=2527974 RepID=A0A518H223_9BACT|nr:GNAT family N-acetyltransferase [Tautonia plasticadhaerens]QDV34874.1 Acetyltransferase (GNAT) family protein [Tautonia plasticadhaerens]